MDEWRKYNNLIKKFINQIKHNRKQSIIQLKSSFGLGHLDNLDVMRSSERWQQRHSNPKLRINGCGYLKIVSINMLVSWLFILTMLWVRILLPSKIGIHRSNHTIYLFLQAVYWLQDFKFIHFSRFSKWGTQSETGVEKQN